MKLFLQVYWFITTLLAIDHILFWRYGISLAGYSSDQLFFWCWFILTNVAIIGNITKKKVWGPLLIFGFLATVGFVPLLFFVGAVLPFAFGGIICEFKINDTYKIQTERKFMLAVPREHLIETFGPIEKDFGPPIEVEQFRARFEAKSQMVTDTTDLSSINYYDYSKELCDVKSARVLSVVPTIRIELSFEDGTKILAYKKK